MKDYKSWFFGPDITEQPGTRPRADLSLWGVSACTAGSRPRSGNGAETAWTPLRGLDRAACTGRRTGCWRSLRVAAEKL